MSAHIEEVSTEDEVNRTYRAYQMALAAQKERFDTSARPVKEDAKLEQDKWSGQFQYNTKVEDPDVVLCLYNRAMATSVSVTPGELLAVSPDLQKLFVESCKVNRITVYSVTEDTVSWPLEAASLVAQVAPLYTAPIMELDVMLVGKHPKVGLYDTGAELVCISTLAAKELKLPFNPDRRLCMRDANGGTKTTFGVVENLDVQINGISVLVHAWIIENAPYWLLLGRPFQLAAHADTEEAGDILVIIDPAHPGHRLRIPMRPHTPSHILYGLFLSAVSPSLLPRLSSIASPLSWSYLKETYSHTVPALGLRYKPVDRKVCPVPTTLPEAARLKCRFPEDSLASLAPMNMHPPHIMTYGQRLTKEQWEAFHVAERGFLWQEEIKLAFDVLKRNEEALAWDDTEKGWFHDDYFAPIVVPTIEHKPWALKNIPIPPGLRTPVINFIKEKIASSTYEPSGSSYRSRWFRVPKKNGNFRIVYDLQPLNAVTVKDTGMPPNVEPYAENAAGRAIYTLGNLFTDFDHASVAEESRDLFTFHTPLGPHRLTCLPMGWTNSVAIFQGHVTFILQDEIEKAPPYLDDVPVLGPRTRYEMEDGTYETMPANPGIRHFVWEHLMDVNRIFHRMKHAGGTFSGHKLFLCVPEVSIVGHTCNYQGHILDQTCVSKIETWPPCSDVSDVCGFLGTCGVVCIFIRGYAEISRPLVNLTKKGVQFMWGILQQDAMDRLKHSILSAPALSPIDYTAKWRIIVAVNSSQWAVGWIIFQLDTQGQRKPARYGSIAWNE